MLLLLYNVKHGIEFINTTQFVQAAANDTER